MAMEQQVFKQFQALIERISGIHLVDEKIELLSNRIQKRIRALSLNDEREYLEIIESNESSDELVQLINVVSTNVTYFWRESAHYEKLAEILKNIEATGKRKIRIWCAACSSGEEAYNIAMVANENLKLSQFDFKILASDISTKVLEQALSGVYLTKQLEHLPELYQKKYFNKVSPVSYQVSPTLTPSIIFKKVNLAQFPYAVPAGIDIIFCRNVMIYFDLPLREKIVNEFSRKLVSGGHMFLSHSENLLGITHSYKSVAVAVYQKPDSRPGYAVGDN